MRPNGVYQRKRRLRNRWQQTKAAFVEDMKNVQINIGAVVKEADEWDQRWVHSPSPAWQHYGVGII